MAKTREYCLVNNITIAPKQRTEDMPRGTAWGSLDVGRSWAIAFIGFSGCQSRRTADWVHVARKVYKRARVCVFVCVRACGGVNILCWRVGAALCMRCYQHYLSPPVSATVVCRPCAANTNRYELTNSFAIFNFSKQKSKINAHT